MMSTDLHGAIRQYKHNDGSEGFIIAYDKEETEKVFSRIESNIKVKTLSNLRDAIQPAGLINSGAGIKTIESITNAINTLINLELNTKKG